MKLKLLPRNQYTGVNTNDPIRFYYWPVIGRMYRKRVEMCLNECQPAQRILEIGFGTGLTFLNLHDIYSEIHGLDLTADAQAVAAVFASRNVQTFLSQGSVLQMPYADNFFDTVLLISILEHLKPSDLPAAFAEIRRILKPGGQVVYGVPVERRLMVLMFRLLGYNIREHHFSSERNISDAADAMLTRVIVRPMRSTPPGLGSVYEVGHFRKAN
jgi:ubiquinone/menaquinone biosynthesis C-methylase UbiE